jgi:hypothetical protein
MEISLSNWLLKLEISPNTSATPFVTPSIAEVKPQASAEIVVEQTD